MSSCNPQFHQHLDISLISINKLPFSSSQCVVWCYTIIFVLALFKFPVTLNSFTRVPSYTSFIAGTVSYCSSSSFCCSLASSSAVYSIMSSILSHPYPILSIILLYNKEAVSRTLYSLSASESLVAATVADTALHSFEIVFLKLYFSKMYSYLLYLFLEIFWKNVIRTKKMSKGNFPYSVFYAGVLLLYWLFEQILKVAIYIRCIWLCATLSYVLIL